MIRFSCNRDTPREVSHRHQRCNVGLRSPRKPRRIRGRSPSTRSERGTARTTRRSTQRRADGIRRRRRGQCHLRFTQLPTIAQVFPRGGRISNKRIIHGRSLSRQLRDRAGNYAMWPGLTTTLISKHFPDSDETQKGHMKGQRKGVRSTKVKPAVEIKIEPGQEDAPPNFVAIRKLNDIFVKIYELAETIRTDQTGAFPVTSQRGYRYIMVGIHIDANYIFCETMKNRTEGEMINAYQKMVDRMLLSGLGLKHHWLDNECSENFKKCIRQNSTFAVCEGTRRLCSARQAGQEIHSRSHREISISRESSGFDHAHPPQCARLRTSGTN